MEKEELEQLKTVLLEHTTDQQHSAEALIEASFQLHMQSDHHRFVEATLLKQQRKAAQWEKMKGNYFFAIALTGTSTVGYWFWDNFKDIMRAVFK